MSLPQPRLSPYVRQSTDADVAAIHEWLQEQERADVHGTFLCNWRLTEKCHQRGDLLVYIDPDTQVPVAQPRLPVFEERWKPAMVKFVAPAGDSAPYGLATALCYLRECDLNGRPGYGAVWCFDGANEAVPAERIVGVEWL